jgi:hypothetical protein
MKIQIGAVLAMVVVDAKTSTLSGRVKSAQWPGGVKLRP